MQKPNNRDQIAIKLSGVTKKYTIHHEKPTLVERLTNGKEEEFWALKDINLTIKKGERVGIIGPNGSGKTTLLKIIAGITTPTSGTVETHGKIVSLIDLEAGFHPDLTGEQNIYLNGMLLGMSKFDITKKLDRIIRFADIKQFIDTPLFTYSTGMKFRLGFGIAIYCDPDIFLIDEALVVGDSDFRLKCLNAIKCMTATVTFVSQELPFVFHLASRTVIMEKGINQTNYFYEQMRYIRSLPKHTKFIVSVTSESMSYQIKKGDNATIKRVPFATIRRGDIIAFSFPNLMLPLIHRVAEITRKDHRTLLITKGDASVGFDAWRVEERHYLGKVINIHEEPV